jgi:gustatory receptor
VDNATKKEVEMFLVAIDKNPPTMNLDGYANINRGLITAVSAKFKNKTQKNRFTHRTASLQNISFMATYLVVLMQFKLTLLRQSAKKALIAAVTANITAGHLKIQQQKP